MSQAIQAFTLDSASPQIPFPRLQRVYDIFREPSYLGLRIGVWQMPAAEALAHARRHIERMGA